MSTKTMKQRIALVAVSALTAGVLSVMSAPVANAATIAAGKFGIAVTNANAATTATLDTGNARSLGFIADTSASAAGRVETNSAVIDGGAIKTATVFANAQITFMGATAATANHGLSFVVTGGRIGSVAADVEAGDDAVTTLAANQQELVLTSADNTTDAIGAVFTISAAAGSTATISMYSGTGVTTSAPTAAALIGRWVFTVVSSSVSNIYNADQSSIFIQAPKAVTAAAAGSDAFDYALPADNGQVHVVYVALKDVYGSAVTSGTLLASANGTSNVNVVEGTPAAGDAYSATATFDSTNSSALGSDGIGYIYVTQPTSNVAGSTTLTISLNGNVLSTKTLRWNGDIASIAVVEASSAKTFLNPTTMALAGGTSTASPAAAIKNIIYVAKDAAGNTVELSSHPTIGDTTGSMVGASLSTADAGTAATDDSQLQTKSVGYGIATMLVPSSTLRGVGTYKVKITNAAGASISSSAVNVSVSGSVNTFTASWDKATYAPGEIATLTITGLDSGGRPVGTGVALGSTALVTTNTDGLASVTSSCDAANIVTATSAYYTDGVKTCKFAVKNTEGAYSYTVVVASASSQAAIAGTVAIKASTATVSNADVLKSIVALIASINKQIQALQKLILRR